MRILKAAILTSALTLTLPNCNQENKLIEGELKQLSDTERRKSLEDHFTDAKKFYYGNPPQFSSSVPDSLEPPYTMTMQQLKFLQEAGAPVGAWAIREFSTEVKENVRKGRLTGDPLKDCLEAFYHYNNTVEFDYMEWREKMSLEFKMSPEEVDMAYALRGLSIIDGAPEYFVPSKEQLKQLRESGLIDKVSERWEHFSRGSFNRIIRQDLSMFIDRNLISEEEVETIWLDYRIPKEERKLEFENLTSLKSKYQNMEKEFLRFKGAAVAYIDWRLFMDIPQSERLVVYPVLFE